MVLYALVVHRCRGVVHNFLAGLDADLDIRIIERMCEQMRDPGSLDDAALNASIAGWGRAEAAAAGQRLASIAELVTRRLGSRLAQERQHWVCDAWDSCAAEVASDLVITHRKASGLMYLALDLRDRFTLVGALLRLGEIPLRVASAISFRTHLIEDPDLVAAVDAEIAEVASRWGRFSEERISDAIDARIERHDPDAVRRFRSAKRGMDVRFGKQDDETGTRSVFGRMSAVDAEVSERRITAMVDGVCPDDPRTVGERRTEAWGVIAAGGDFLPCLCANPDCPASGPDARGRLFDILVLTDDPDAGERVVDEEPPTPAPDGDPPPYDPDYDWERHWHDDPPADEEGEVQPPEDEPDRPKQPAEPLEPAAAEQSEQSDRSAECVSPASEFTPDSGVPCRYTSIFAGGGILPAALLADLRRMGASVRTVINPGDSAPEARYRPSAALQRMVRARDMTCRFTGCDRPAEYCDVDHTMSYADSRLTHPGNTKMLCRKHHLLKTFWVGRGGWTDEQLSDGTILWTSPSGREHRAPPGSRIFFPNWDTTTPLPDSTTAVAAEPSPDRGLRMPKRRRTRAQQRAANIRAERKRNREAADNTPAAF